MHTVISVFGEHKAARRALACLVEAGFPRQHVHLVEGAPPAGYAERYEQAVRRGDSVVIVEVDDAGAAERTSRILRELGASDVDAPVGQPAAAREMFP